MLGLLVALAASTFAVVTVITRDSARAEVYLEAAAKRGPDAFTDSVANDTKEITTAYKADGKTGSNVVLTVTGNEPGLYGGTRNEQSCDPTKLVKFLEDQPAKAAAWAGVLGIRREDISGYVNGLTPVVLRADTRVTNHGYANGKATTRQAVLQAGTAVLVDSKGIPRVRCSCGNPLTEPEAVEPDYTGTPWPAFEPAKVIAVNGGQTTETLTLTDLGDGTTFNETAGAAAETGVIAIGTDDGLVLMKDGLVIDRALAGQSVWGLAESSDGSRLAIFSNRPDAVAANGSGYTSSTLRVLDHTGAISTITDLMSARSTPVWIDDTHIAYAAGSDSGNTTSPEVVEVTPGGQPATIDALGSYPSFVGTPGGATAIGVPMYKDDNGPRWIDFSTKTESPSAILNFSDCGNGGPHSCGSVTFSPSGKKVLAVVPDGVEIADVGQPFTREVSGRYLDALWADDETIAYTSTLENASGRSQETLHLHNLGTSDDRSVGDGLVIGRVGHEVVVRTYSADGFGLVLVDARTGARRDLVGLPTAGTSGIYPKTITAAGESDGVLLAADDTTDWNYAFLVDTKAARIAPLLKQHGGPLASFNVAARSPATSITSR